MLDCNRWLRVATVLTIFAAGAAAQTVTATIDTSHTGQPISKLIFGGFMEPATTRVWAEMLTDRKFFHAVDSKPPTAPLTGFMRRFGPLPRWVPVGGDEFVTMDRKNAFVGEWSPMIRLESQTEHGIEESGFSLSAGRAYTGRVVLAGKPGTTVTVSLIWGPGAEDRQRVAVRLRSERYTTYPLTFTAKAETTKGELEIAATGSGAFHVGAVSLMPADNISGFKADQIRMLKEQGIEIARWPGGNFVSAYNWRDGIGESDKRPPRRELAWSSMESNDMGIDDFMTFCRLLGATPYIAVNTGLGDAQSAAAEVEYVNGPATSPMGKWRAANGHAAPYGVTIWGIGNEMYGPWQWGHIPINQYVEKHNMVVAAMREVDPSIEVIASGATPEEISWTYIENRQFASFDGREAVADKVPFAIGSSYDWTGGLLEHSADSINYLGEHFYGYPDWYVDEATQQFVPATGDPMEDKVRRMSNRVEYKFEAWDEYVRRMPSLKDKNIKFAFDEWSPRAHALPAGAGPATPDDPMLNPLTEALVYHEFFRHSDQVGLAVATGGMGMMAMNRDGDAIGLRTDGMVMKVLHDHFAGALPVTVSGNSPQHAIKGTVGVDTSARPSGSPTWPLDVFAALSADHKMLVVSVVNPTETEQSCTLVMNAVKTAAPVKLWRLTRPVTVAGKTETPAPGRFAPGPPATLAESTLPATPETLTLPAASLNVYEFQLQR